MFGVHTVVDFAAIFHRAAHVLNEDARRSNVLPLLAPLNETLALELYLKALHLVAFDEFPVTHDLHRLFVKLPEEHLSGLRERFAVEISALREQDRHLASWEEHVVRPIEGMRQAFTTLRYFFEGTTGRLEILPLRLPLRVVAEYLGSIDYDTTPKYRRGARKSAPATQGGRGNRKPASIQALWMYAGWSAQGLVTLEREIARTPDGLLVMASAVNSGFVLEIYLKLLCVLTRSGYPPTHSLRKLFRFVPENHRSALVGRFSEATGDTAEEFERMLDDGTEAFMRVRYAFEDTSASFNMVGVVPAIAAIDAYVTASWPQPI